MPRREGCKNPDRHVLLEIDGPIAVASAIVRVSVNFRANERIHLAVEAVLEAVERNRQEWTCGKRVEESNLRAAVTDSTTNLPIPRLIYRLHD